MSSTKTVETTRTERNTLTVGMIVIYAAALMAVLKWLGVWGISWAVVISPILAMAVAWSVLLLVWAVLAVAAYVLEVLAERK